MKIPRRNKLKTCAQGSAFPQRGRSNSPILAPLVNCDQMQEPLDTLSKEQKKGKNLNISKKKLWIAISQNVECPV